MKINIVAVGTRMPSWVTAGFQEYTKRLSHVLPLHLIEIPLTARGSGDIKKMITKEGQAMCQAIPNDNFVIALDVKGQQWDTPKLAQQLQQWQNQRKDISLLIGGPDGLAPACLERATLRWSLSPLTLPHPLVRVVIAEQLYRAWSILNRHPYHRE